MFYENLMNYPSFVPGYLPNQETRNLKTSNEVFATPQMGFNRGNLSDTSYYTYKGYIPRTPELLSDKERAMYALGVYYFAMHDLKLYLDLHPNDLDAQKLYIGYQKEANRLKEGYISDGTLPKEEGYSNKGPWPWEGR